MVRIYTKTGDQGQTGLWGGARVPKSHPRVAAYGDVDELNCELGAVLASLPSDEGFSPLRRTLARIQAELFSVGAVLATPQDKASKAAVGQDAVAALEREIDAWTAELPALEHFILPGGAAAGAALHVARAVCRRAERSVVALAGGEKVPSEIVVYLNRLSDHLFTAARWVNAKQGRAETPWQGPSA